jgi:hypothetical protein
VSDQRKKRMGRDAFDEKESVPASDTVARLIRGRSPLTPDAREVPVTVRLTPATLKHIDALQRRLAERGREISRDELIRIAITLLSAEDVT